MSALDHVWQQRSTGRPRGAKSESESSFVVYRIYGCNVFFFFFRVAPETGDRLHIGSMSGAHSNKAVVNDGVAQQRHIRKCSLILQLKRPVGAKTRVTEISLLVRHPYVCLDKNKQEELVLHVLPKKDCVSLKCFLRPKYPPNAPVSHLTAVSFENYPQSANVRVRIAASGSL